MLSTEYILRLSEKINSSLQTMHIVSSHFKTEGDTKNLEKVNKEIIILKDMQNAVQRYTNLRISDIVENKIGIDQI